MGRMNWARPARDYSGAGGTWGWTETIREDWRKYDVERRREAQASGGRYRKRGPGKNTVVVPGDGDPCPRCSKPTQIRAHAVITEKLRAQASYRSRWFYCTNESCPTQEINDERFAVYPSGKPVPARDIVEQLHEVPEQEFKTQSDLFEPVTPTPTAAPSTWCRPASFPAWLDPHDPMSQLPGTDMSAPPW